MDHDGSLQRGKVCFLRMRTSRLWVVDVIVEVDDDADSKKKVSHSQTKCKCSGVQCTIYV
jgi:hypothetical protein